MVTPEKKSKGNNALEETKYETVDEIEKIKNQEQDRQMEKVIKSDSEESKKKQSVIEIYRKLENRPMGSMFGLQQMIQLGEIEKDQLLLPMDVDDGAKNT